jgi:hypothetical protein
MKTRTVFFAFSAVLFCAGAAFAGEDPESYRMTLLRRDLGKHESLCKSQPSYENCKVTLNFLKDINAGQVPKKSDGKDLCPLGADTRYSFGAPNQAKIEARCT